MPRHLFRLALATLCPLLLAASIWAAPKWHTLQAPHCLIVSQLSERETREWASQFEQFTTALRSKIAIEERFLPPLTVVLFADTGTFKPYYPTTAEGKKQAVAGYFASRETWGVIALADAFTDEQTRHVVLHEATHWLTSATRTRLPLWLMEGTAEVFSTFQPKKDHGILGEPIPAHLQALRNEAWVPLFELLLTTNNSPRYTDNRTNHIFYAQSWLLAHKLFFENPASGHAILNRFFAARVLGTDQIAAFETAFGKDIPTVEKEIEHYSRGGRFTFTKLPLPPEAKIEAPFIPAPPLAVEIALARLAIGSKLHALARTHIDRALVLDPTSPTPRELLALLEFELANSDAAFAAARQALDQGSRDAMMHVIVAQDLRRRHNDRGTLSTGSREIVDHLAQAIALQPKLRSAYLNYASLASALPDITVSDAQLLTSGYKLFPDEAYLLVSLAAVVHKAGNDEEAQRLLGLAFAHPDNLTEQQRSSAERLRSEWQIEPLRQKMDELAKQRRYREAVAECEKLLLVPMQQQPHQFWEKHLVDLHFRATLQEADEAMAAQNAPEAARILEALLAQPDLPQPSAQQVRKRLEHVRRFLPNPALPPQPAVP